MFLIGMHFKYYINVNQSIQSMEHKTQLYQVIVGVIEEVLTVVDIIISDKEPVEVVE